jgi:biotin carboxylase
VRIAAQTGYQNLGTFEFLVDADAAEDAERFYFIEANARLQVEHTVTEAVTGLDLVQAQIRLAAGASLAELGIDRPGAPRGFAVQARVNLERIGSDGEVRPSGGVLAAYEPPGGPGVRVDGFGYAGYRTSAAFDSLLAKVIGHAPSDDPAEALRRTSRALAEFRIEGVETNIPLLRRILAHPDLAAGRAHTRWLDEHVGELTREAEAERSRWNAAPASAGDGFAGARIDTRDPLALFEHDARTRREPAAAPATGLDPARAGPAGAVGQAAPIKGTVASLAVA